MNLAEIETNLKAQRKRIDGLLADISAQLSGDNPAVDARGVQLQSIESSLRDTTGALWNTTRNERGTVPITQTQARVVEINRQLETADGLLRQKPAPEPKAQPAPTPDLKPKVDKQEASPAKRTPVLSDTELQKLMERLRAHDKHLESIANGIDALNKDTIPANQRATLALLHDLLSDPKSLGALKLLLKIGKWIDARRRPTPKLRPAASAKASETRK